MKLNERGWLLEYIQFRKNSSKRQLVDQGRHPDYSLYRMLQPTGLIYGKAIQRENFKKNEFDKLGEADKAKILLAESLINTTVLFLHKDQNENDKLNKLLENSPRYISDFYNRIFPDVAISPKTLFGKEKNPFEVAEKIIEKRVNNFISKHKQNFWIDFFSKSLLFLDVYLYSQWIHTGSEKTVVDYFREQKEDLRLSVIKVMVAAAHANDIMEIEEKKMFEFLLDAAMLDKTRNKEAWRVLNEGILAEEIALPENNSWLLKKYFLEIAILTVWADREVDDAEREFLNNLNKHLGFFEDDLDKSMMAIEAFVIQNWDQMGELQDRKDFKLLSDEFEKRLTSIVSQYESKIRLALNSDERIQRLFQKYTDGTLTPEEQAYLKELVIDELQKLSVFSNISLPDNFLSLDLLFKVLPAPAGHEG